MAYAVDQIKTTLSNDTIGRMQEAELWMDIFGGRYPLLSDTDGNLRPDVFPAMTREEYDGEYTSGDSEAQAIYLFKQTFVAGDGDFIAEAERLVDIGVALPIVVTGPEFVTVTEAANEMADHIIAEEGLTRAWAKDYFVYDLSNWDEEGIKVTAFISVFPCK